MDKLSPFLFAALLSFCATATPAAPAGPAPLNGKASAARFSPVAAEFIDGYLAWRPQQGAALGLHEYDGKTTDLSAASIAAELSRLRHFESILSALPPESPGADAAYDRRLLLAAIRNEIFSFEDVGGFTKNPMTYARAVDVNLYIQRNFAPLANRARSIIAIERAAPGIFLAAHANLEAVLAKPFVETAIEIADGSADFLGHDLVTALKPLQSGDPELFAEFTRVNERAIAEERGFSAWLKTERLARASDQFALGRDKFQRMLREGELIDYTPEQILEIGLRELKREQGVFAGAARKIDPALPPIEVFKAIQKDHPTAEGLLPDVRKDLETIRRFILEHHVISIPSGVRPKVEETPQYDRASSFASMDTPGPFETKANEAYYYVTPTEKEWPEKQKEEWLTAFNYYTTDIVSVHEVYPGHYVQFLHLNASKADRLEKIFSSYAFVEGWAHYTEQMLLDEGFGREGGGVKAEKYRLAQSDEALLRTCRLCASIKMHCQGMTVDEAAKFFEDNCYYEPKPARAEAVRGTFDPGYLYYTLGKLEIFKLRGDWAKQEGAAYSLERFHEELLQYGMPPIRLLRERMLRDPAAWSAIF